MRSYIAPAIGFCGKAKSGKDTAVSFLVDEYGYKRVAFADPLKEELSAQLSRITSDWLDCLQRHAMAEAWMGLVADFRNASCDGQEFIANSKDMCRPFLQLYGTEFRRAQDEHYWVKETTKRLRPGMLYAFSDYRFRNEGCLIAEMRGIRCALYRESSGATNGIEGHSSEDINALPKDIGFWNNGSLDQLRQFCLLAVRLRV